MGHLIRSVFFFFFLLGWDFGGEESTASSRPFRRQDVLATHACASSSRASFPPHEDPTNKEARWVASRFLPLLSLLFFFSGVVRWARIRGVRAMSVSSFIRPTRLVSFLLLFPGLRF